MPVSDIQSERRHAHLLLDVLPDEKVSVVKNMLEGLIDPLARALANAPLDDEPVSEEEAREVAASRASFGRKNTSNEELLAEFGLAPEDFEEMGRAPLQSDTANR
ncbi:MAG TPA: hypothetical protein VHZ52_13495 [Acidobacteriaceae bacterium]|jgi:hypothetical protein|nr:hypothetical protein [Acidobacteriaceae bacterium]